MKHSSMDFTVDWVSNSAVSHVHETVVLLVQIQEAFLRKQMSGLILLGFLKDHNKGQQVSHCSRRCPVFSSPHCVLGQSPTSGDYNNF